MKTNDFGRGRKQEPIEVVNNDLRALLFWASVGVTKAAGGSYGNEIINIIESYAEHLGISFKSKWGFAPKFMTETAWSAKMLGSQGGKARAKKLSAKRRKEIATKASHSRKPRSSAP